MNLLDRMQAPTPSFLKKLRNIGLILTAISGTIIAAPLALPALVIQVATYIGVASTIASAVSQVTVQGETQ